MSVSFVVSHQDDIVAATGGYKQVTEEVRRKVSALTKSGKTFWVGIASQGDDGSEAR